MKAAPGARRRRGAPPTAPRGVRAAAARAVDESLASRAPVDGILARLGSSLDERDRRLLAELVYGTLRWLARLDHLIARVAERPLAAIDADLRSPLRVGVLQLVALERVPAHAAVSETVEEARRRRGRGAAGFANAVLRRVARNPRWDAWPVEAADAIERLAIEGSHPRILVERWWRHFGEERARTIVEANNGAREVHLLGFAHRGGRDRLAERLAGEGVATRASRHSPAGLVVERGQPLRSSAFARGEFYVQDEASQAAALVPPPRAGERTLDVAAAPGGKVFAVLATEPGARLVAADASLARLLRFDENLARLGLDVPRLVSDASCPPWDAAFDRVVVDAPCTGTGTLRRHPELRWRFSLAELERLAAESEAMLRGASAGVRRGGILTLVTCSIEPEENESVASRFLAAAPDFEVSSVTESGNGGAGERGLWRLFPGDGHDGFTVHVLRRKR